MSTRRDFLKTAALLAAGGSLPPSIARALSIDPAQGSSWMDAEHVVIVMQENRSFDHTYGTLRGVRGYNDPRAITQPDGNPVWLQTGAAGDTYAPFRLDIRNTKATWMGSLPHGWIDQANARNHGRHDGWIDAKAIDNKEYAHMPLTLGYYTREDLPFYYALADAFTICDQNFCSSLTATEPNRLHLWTGTVRARQSIEAKANVLNEDMGYDLTLDWMTFPERLEEAGVSWKIYQNEISLPTGFSDEEDSWLSNFDDNTLEYFVNYRVRFSPARRSYLQGRKTALQQEIAALEAQPAAAQDAKKLAALREEMDATEHELATCSPEAFAQLTEHEQNVHRKAFTTNEGDPDYRALESMRFHDGEAERTMQVPKGDVLYRFREDARAGKLPAVSWIVPPERFSDHPCSPWYGAWYLSETLDILTRDPELWKKTVLIVCYDENDGYYDHVPPFVPPQAGRADTGAVSAGIDPSVEYVSEQQEAAIRAKDPSWKGEAGPIGLGFRVPLVIVSPWSRGGFVNSEVFDHTSILQFLEKFVNHRYGRDVRETNISAWRRNVCGDLTSTFRAYSDDKAMPTPVERDAFFRSIYDAQFQPVPNNFHKFSAADVAEAQRDPRGSALLPRQEAGVKPACALPYELGADGALTADRRSFAIRFSAGRTLFGDRAAGAPFRVYTNRSVRTAEGSSRFEKGRAWDYALTPGDALQGAWALEDFENSGYALRVYGPNGFYREFEGTANDPLVAVQVAHATDDASAGGALSLRLKNNAAHAVALRIEDVGYGGKPRRVVLGAAANVSSVQELRIDVGNSAGWYDLRVAIEGTASFHQRYAGHVETGRESTSDPLMGAQRT